MMEHLAHVSEVAKDITDVDRLLLAVSSHMVIAGIKTSGIVKKITEVDREEFPNEVEAMMRVSETMLSACEAISHFGELVDAMKSYQYIQTIDKE